MKPRHPICLHAALRGELRVGAVGVPWRAVTLQTASRVGVRSGGMSVPI